MSYNVDTWKTKELKDLVIPMSAFFKHERKDWHPEVVMPNPETNEVVVKGGCEQEIKGTILNGMLTVTSIDQMYGEGSGTYLDWIVEPALKESTGTLVAVRIWEGGDSVDRLTVIDGVVKSEPVEL